METITGEKKRSPNDWVSDSYGPMALFIAKGLAGFCSCTRQSGTTWPSLQHVRDLPDEA